MGSPKCVRLVLFWLAVFSGQLFGTPLDVRWARQVSGTQFELGYGVDTDSAGNVYVTGYFHSPTLAIGSLTLTNSLPNGTNANAYVAKMDSAGNVLWARSIAGATESSSIAVDGSGNSYITGRYVSPTLTIDHLSLTNNSTVSPFVEIFTAKFDGNGNVLWVRSAGGSGNDTGFAVATDDVGNCYVTGWFRDAPAHFGHISLQNSGSFNWFVTKYDPVGQVLWAHASHGNGDAQAKGIAVDAQGNVFVTGRISGAIYFGALFFSLPSYDFALVKYDPSGIPLWARVAGGAHLDYGSSVALDGTGNAYVTGYFESSTMKLGSITLTNSGSVLIPEIFTAKYDSAGNVVWARSVAGSGEDEGRQLAADPFGNIYVTGFFNSPTLAAGDLALTNRNSTSSSDIFLLKYDAVGNLLQAEAFGGSANDAGRGITADPSGNILISGSFTGPATFGGTNFIPAGSADAFFAKLSPDTIPPGPDPTADFVWARSAGGPDSDTQGGVAVDSAGNVYVSGHFSSSMAFGSTNLTSRGDVDIYFAKYDPNGNLLWVQQMGGTGSDTSPTLLLDHSNCIYVSGYYSGTATFGSTNLTSAGAGDIYLAKYSSDGALLWVQRAGGNGADHSINLALDSSNCVYLGGYYRTVSTFGSQTITVTTSCGAPRSDAYVAKYLPNGTLAWVVGGGSCHDDVTFDVAVNGTNVYSVGYFRTNATFSGVSLAHSGVQDAFITKYDNNGNLDWIRTAAGSGLDIAQNVCTDSSGNVYVLGVYESNPLSFGSTNLANAGAQDLFFAKYTPTGSLAWAKRIGGSGNEGTGALLIDGAGDLWVAGTFQNTVSFGTTDLTSKGAGDIFLARYGQDGSLLWLKSWGSTGSDAASDLDLRADGEIYLSGVFSGTVTFGNDTLTSMGSTDSFVGKLSSEFVLTLPVLQADRSGQTLLLSWPASFEHFTLQYCGELGGVWQNAVITPARIENRWVVPVSMFQQQQYFRLVRP